MLASLSDNIVKDAGSREEIIDEIMQHMKPKAIELMLTDKKKNDVIIELSKMLRTEIIGTLKKHDPDFIDHDLIAENNLKSLLDTTMPDIHESATDMKNAMRGIRAVYDSAQLQNLDSGLQCAITVNVDMKSFQLGFSGGQVGNVDKLKLT